MAKCKKADVCAIVPSKTVFHIYAMYRAKGSPSFIIVIMFHPSRCFLKSRDDASRKSTFSPRERIGLLVLCKYFGNISAVALLALDQSHRAFGNVL